MSLTPAQSQFLAALAPKGNVLHVRHTRRGDVPRVLSGIGVVFPSPALATVGWAENNGLIKNDSTDSSTGSYFSITRKGRELYEATARARHARV